MDPIAPAPPTAAWYAAFAEREARGSSPTYEAWSLGISLDPAILGLIDELPPADRQPNLVFAAARVLGAPAGPYDAFRDWLALRWTDVAATARERRTQTNEAGRCATLLPLLAEIDGPLALLEVGASAGLCLYPDRYSYEYEAPSGTVRLDPRNGVSDVALACRIDSAAHVPRALPEVVWRAGIDLNPLDVTDAADVAWLTALIWPEHDARAARLRAAARIVAADPPEIVAGDLNDTLRATAARAPVGARLVVFHTAVLAYLDAAQREEFVRTVSELDAVWISNEGRAVLPSVAGRLPAQVGVGRRFVLARDGVPRALADPHGASYEALPGA